MRLLLVVAYWPPEIGSAAHIYFDLARGFAERGHEVHVITSYPRSYNLYKKDHSKKCAMDEKMDGIKVHRCTYPLSRRDLIFLRGIEHFILSYIYYKRFKRLKIDFDACLIYVPPLPLYYFGERIKKKMGVPYVLNFQDIYPDELVDVGVLKNRMVIDILRRMSKSAYKNPDYITSMSPGGVKLIKERGGREDKIECIYNGVDLDQIRKIREIKNFKKNENLEEKFLVTYIGILSPFQGIDDILDVAKMMREHRDVVFYVVGDGMVRKHLEMRIVEEEIDNLKILPFQPREDYFDIINSSDINIVSLDKRMTAPCIPGKLSHLLALGEAIIANVPPDNDTARILRENDCGLVVTPGDLQGFKDAILRLKDDEGLRKSFSENGKKFVEENMDLRKIITRYEGIFEVIS